MNLGMFLMNEVSSFRHPGWEVGIIVLDWALVQISHPFPHRISWIPGRARNDGYGILWGGYKKICVLYERISQCTLQFGGCGCEYPTGWMTPFPPPRVRRSDFCSYTRNDFHSFSPLSSQNFNARVLWGKYNRLFVFYKRESQCTFQLWRTRSVNVLLNKKTGVRHPGWEDKMPARSERSLLFLTLFPHSIFQRRMLWGGYYMASVLCWTWIILYSPTLADETGPVYLD